MRWDYACAIYKVNGSFSKGVKFDEIAAYGEQGWELVSVTTLVNGGNQNSDTREVMYTFKRAL
jgi:hypothetical protein